jgi:hypothetical protein
MGGRFEAGKRRTGESGRRESRAENGGRGAEERGSAGDLGAENQEGRLVNIPPRMALIVTRQLACHRSTCDNVFRCTLRSSGRSPLSKQSLWATVFAFSPCYENPPHPPLPHAGGRARVGVAESGQLARVFIRRGEPGRVMTDCYESDMVRDAGENSRALLPFA